MQTFNLRLISLLPPRKLSTDGSLHSSDCLSKDRSEDTAPDEEVEVSPKRMKTLKEQIENWDEEYKSTIFSTCVIKRKSKLLQCLLDEQISTNNQKSNILRKVKDEYNILSDGLSMKPSNNKCDSKAAGNTEKELSSKIEEMYD